MLKVRAYLGLGSRYSYLASTQLDRIATETGAEFEWVAINSVELIRRARPEGSPFDQPVLLGQYAPEYRHQDAHRWASHYGVAYVEPEISALPSDALALTCWAQPDTLKRKTLIKSIYAALFADGIEMTMDALKKLAGDFDVSAEEIDDALSDSAASMLHEDAIASALDQGVFGVPTFMCEGELFWGNDRLCLLTQHLQTKRVEEPR